MSSKPTMNGQKPHSQTIDHFVSYPLVSDTISMYQKNSLGAKSIDIFHALYDNLAAPVVPYLQTPYSIVAPYLAKVDSLGDSTLKTVDDHFPAVKNTDMSKLHETAYKIITFPFHVAGEGRTYVYDTYSDEYKKTGGKGLVTTGKAIISTELRIAIEAMHKVAEIIGPQAQNAQEKLSSVAKDTQHKLDDITKSGQKTLNDLTGNAQSKAGEYKKEGEAKLNDAKKEGEATYSDTKKEAEKQGKNVKKDVKNATNTN